MDLKRRISDSIESAWKAGYRHFLCGMAQGCDLYFCECVQNLRGYFSGITLEAAIPYPDQSARWPMEQQKRYRILLDSCDLQTMVSSHYSPSCMVRRNHYMVDHASMLIAVFNGTPGGTSGTIEYAMRRRIPVVDLPILTDFML